MRTTRGARLLQYLRPHLIWLIIPVFLRMEPLGPQSLASLWRSQLLQDPVHYPGPQAVMRLPRYKLHHPRRNPPRRNHHRCQDQKQAESLPVELEVEAKDHHHHAEKIVRRLDGALGQAAVVVGSLQRSQVSLLAELGL